MNPKVSILMPSLNVSGFISQCMNSVVSQTLEDIEIICIDAGSTDGTWEILQEFANQDNRIRLIQSDKKSYGYQMNLGLNAAKGDYIGIVETDDWADSVMFEKLYSAAEDNRADVAFSNYFQYSASEDEKSVFFENLAGCTYNKLINGTDDNFHLFLNNPAIWTGLYKREFLKNNQICFNETPGAAYQDSSFYLIVCTTASSIYLLKEAFLHYRIDNENSSVKSAGKIYAICDEMHFYENYVHQFCDEKKYMPICARVKFGKYLWNYNRISGKYQKEFLNKIRAEFTQDDQNGYYQKDLFSETDWHMLHQILQSPYRFYLATCKGDNFYVRLRDSYFSRKAG